MKCKIQSGSSLPKLQNLCTCESSLPKNYTPTNANVTGTCCLSPLLTWPKYSGPNASCNQGNGDLTIPWANQWDLRTWHMLAHEVTAKQRWIAAKLRFLLHRFCIPQKTHKAMNINEVYIYIIYIIEHPASNYDSNGIGELCVRSMCFFSPRIGELSIIRESPPRWWQWVYNDMFVINCAFQELFYQMSF